MIQGKENIVEAFKESGRPQWKLYYNIQKVAGASPCAESDPTADAANNADRLQRTLDRLMPGRYNLQCKKDLADNTSIVQLLFEIPGAGGTSPAISGVNYSQPAIGAYTPDVFNQIMDAKINSIQEQHRREMLEKEREAERKELEELRKQDTALPNFLNQWGPGLVQVLMARFGGGAGAQVGMAGFTNPQQAVQFNPEQNQQGPFVQQEQQPVTEETENATQQKLNHVLEWLAKEEGSPEAGVELLHRMMLKAQSNPQLLPMLKNFLN